MASSDQAASRGKRAYHSPKRRQQAEKSRRRILEAAADTFDTLGYTGARMTDVAERAGMSVESVYAVGSKAFLLVEAFKLRYAGEADWESVFDSARAQDIFALTDPVEALDAWMTFLRDANARAARLWFAVRAAAPAEPRVASLLDELWQNRRASFQQTVRWMVSIGMLDAATPHDAVPRLAAEVSTLTSFELYEQLVERWGWSEEEYEAWVRRALAGLRG